MSPHPTTPTLTISATYTSLWLEQSAAAQG
jgi:hypothetical protein